MGCLSKSSYDNLHINPLREAITIMGYRVVDSIGRTVKKGKLNLEFGYGVIDMSSLKAGVYVVQLSDGERTTNKKIVKAAV